MARFKINDLSEYLKEMGYPAELVKKSEQLHIVFKSELANLLSNYDFADFEIEFMIDNPEAITSVRFKCEFQGGIDMNFIENWKKYHIDGTKLPRAYIEMEG